MIGVQFSHTTPKPNSKIFDKTVKMWYNTPVM